MAMIVGDVLLCIKTIKGCFFWLDDKYTVHRIIGDNIFISNRHNNLVVIPSRIAEKILVNINERRKYICNSIHY